MGKRYYPGLDALRLGAALVIVVYHFAVEFAPTWPGLALVGPWYPALLQATESAISLFFLLSGAGLALGYGPQVEKPDWRRYARGRVLAIYPMYWLGFGALFLYGDVLRGGNPGLARWRVVFSLLGLDGYLLQFTPTFYKIGEWFLGCLLLLYALFPLLVRLLRAARAQAAWWCVPAAVCALAWLWLPRAGAGIAYTHTVLWRLPVFFLGMVLAGWLPHRRRCALSGVLCAAAAVLLRLGGAHAAHIAIAESAALFLLAAPVGGTAGAADRARRALRWLAGQCYGVFLVHHVLLTLVFVPRLSWLGPRAAFALYLPACFALAWCLRQAARPLARALGRLWRPGGSPAQ